MFRRALALAVGAVLASPHPAAAQEPMPEDVPPDELFLDEQFVDDPGFDDPLPTGPPPAEDPLGFDDPLLDDLLDPGRYPADDPFLDDPFPDDPFLDTPFAPGDGPATDVPGDLPPVLADEGPGGGGGLPDPERVEQFNAVAAEHVWALPSDLEEEALELLFLEVALLQELDAFTGGGTLRTQEVHAAFAPWPAASRAALVEALLIVDDELAVVKNDVVAELGSAPARVAIALDEIGTAPRQRLQAGEARVLDPQNHVIAMSVFLSQGAADELVRAGLGGLEFEFSLAPMLELLADPAVLADLGLGTNAAGDGPPAADPSGPAAADPGADTPATDDGGIPTAAVVAAIAAGATVLGWLAGRARRRRRPTDGDHSATREIIEAHRRLSGARDQDDIARIATESAVRLTGAADALVLRREPTGLRLAGTDRVFDRTVLDRVVETAQPLLVAVDADPLVNGPVEVCAVPLVADGRITGVLAARRRAGNAFAPADRAHLEQLAPAVAAALDGADELDSFEHLALVDGLTSLGNRRRLDGDLETAIHQAIEREIPVAFAMIDVDHFKAFNDTHGHEAGDAALRTVARVIESTVRADDVVYRYGGEEFSILLPGATLEEAHQVVERVRTAVEAARVDGEESQPGGRLTVSAGVAMLDEQAPHDLKRQADGALYEAKAQGRNRSVTT